MILKTKLRDCSLFQRHLKPEQFILHYTGLPSYQVFKVIFDFVAPTVSRAGTKLAAFQEFMVVLVTLRLNPSSQDLAYRFDVHTSTISRILLKWLTFMDVRLKPLIMWPIGNVSGRQCLSALELSLEKRLWL